MPPLLGIMPTALFNQGFITMQCTRLPQAAFDTLTTGAKVLEADSHGAKVYLLADGNILKLFRRKRLFSSALLRPYSARFIANAQRLQQLGVPTLKVLQHYRLDKPGMTAVLYEPLPGRNLRQLMDTAEFTWQESLEPLIALIRQLHRCWGVFPLAAPGQCDRHARRGIGLDRHGRHELHARAFVQALDQAQSGAFLPLPGTRAIDRLLPVGRAEQGRSEITPGPTRYGRTRLAPLLQGIAVPARNPHPPHQRRTRCTCKNTTPVAAAQAASASHAVYLQKHNPCSSGASRVGGPRGVPARTQPL
ncbi:hypothetical protein ABMD26_002692 [Pseudomonas sp. PvP001]